MTNPNKRPNWVDRLFKNKSSDDGPKVRGRLSKPAVDPSRKESNAGTSTPSTDLPRSTIYRPINSRQSAAGTRTIFTQPIQGPQTAPIRNNAAKPGLPAPRQVSKGANRAGGNAPAAERSTSTTPNSGSEIKASPPKTTFPSIPAASKIGMAIPPASTGGQSVGPVPTRKIYAALPAVVPMQPRAPPSITTPIPQNAPCVLIESESPTNDVLTASNNQAQAQRPTTPPQEIFRDIQSPSRRQVKAITDTGPSNLSSPRAHNTAVIQDLMQTTPRAIIRLITPASVYQRQDIAPLLYNGGNPIPLSTTLRQLKVGIAQQLGIQDLHLPPKATAADPQHICNCAFAGSIAENGIWEMLRCRIHDSPNGDCDYPHAPTAKSKDCLVCHVGLQDPCEDCSSSDAAPCPLVINAGCDHTFHYHCYKKHVGDTCPGGCSRSIYPREMVPQTTQKMLIVTYGTHQLKLLKLGQDFGGRQAIATVSIEKLKETVRRMIGTRGKDVCMHLLNGIQEGENVKFRHSLVISLCESDRHVNDRGAMAQGFHRVEVRSLRTSVPPTAAPVALPPTASVLLDLHTRTALIGRTDLDVTLDYLRLDEETVNGYIDLYVVARNWTSESGDATEIGKEALYRLKDSWKIRDASVKDADYACYLSALRVFVSHYERNEGQQNTLLEVATQTMRFPPAVRALHDLIKQKVPMREDRAALTQCLFEYYKTIKDPTRSFDVQFPRLAFGQLYGEIRTRPDSSSTQYLDAFQTEYFICPITQKIVDRGVCFGDTAEDRTIIDASIASLYSNGPLRKTVFQGAPMSPGSVGSRLGVYSGGRFEEMSYFNSVVFETKPVANIVPRTTRNDGVDGDLFAIIPPKDLGPVNPPALTRDSLGVVSVYLGEAECTLPPVNTLLFNPLKGEHAVDVSLVSEEITKLKEAAPSHYEFMVHGKITDGREPDEILMICLDTSYSMEEDANFVDTRAVGNRTDIDRMQVVKQIFDIFINRTIAYDYAHHIGLITFASTAKEVQAIGSVIQRLRAAVANITPCGNTALWDALVLAEIKLSAYGAKYPKAKKRIVVLSDGENNQMNHTAFEACQRLQRADVIVDSFVIGGTTDKELKAISHATGGYKFAPRTFDSTVSICELETVLCLADRPNVSRYPRVAEALWRFELYKSVNYDNLDRQVAPPLRLHPNFSDTFLRLRDASIPRVRARAATGAARIQSEMARAISESHPYYDIYVSEQNMGFWKVVMKGPIGSMYSAGTFLMCLEMDSTFPSFAPKPRFVTPILHPNITRQGKVCHSILDRNWMPNTTIVTILNCIWALLLAPDMDDPTNLVLTQLHYSEEAALEVEIRQHVERHAMKSRQAWANEISPDDAPSTQKLSVLM